MSTPSYKYPLGEGLYLDIFSLDPKIWEGEISTIATSLEGKANLDLGNLSKTIIKKGHIDSIQQLKLIPEQGKYNVPSPLQPYREAIQKDWDSKGRFNGPVLIATGEIANPLRVIQGGYYDFAATKLSNKPADLLPEVYQEGETVGEILTKNGINLEKRARYFGLAHLIWPSNGEEFLLVQRAKGMGIAADCISTPGSTPDLVLNSVGLTKSGFGITEWWSYHLAEEMKDEFNLRWGDFGLQICFFLMIEK